MATQQQINTFVDEIERLNLYINAHGQIQRSSVIKHWHDLYNGDWLDIFQTAQQLDTQGYWNLAPWITSDLERLVSHITNYHTHADNIVFPSPKAQRNMPKRLTQFSSDRSVKSAVFKTMMNIREAYCDLFAIDLPNDDSSIGALDPKPQQTLFEF